VRTESATASRSSSLIGPSVLRLDKVKGASRRRLSALLAAWVPGPLVLMQYAGMLRSLSQARALPNSQPPTPEPKRSLPVMVIMWVSDFETAGLAAITLSASVATAPAANASERASRLAADRCLLLM
jgi:hypothetical protein